jgi:hypothetical protein
MAAIVILASCNSGARSDKPTESKPSTVVASAAVVQSPAFDPTILANNDQFAVCQSIRVQISHHSEHFSYEKSMVEYYQADFPSEPIEALERAGYVVQHLDGNPPYFALTAVGRSAIGKNIRQRQEEKPYAQALSPNFVPQAVFPKSCSPEDFKKAAEMPYSCTEPLEWVLVFGCPELSSVDATTPLADGVKVDFSWHWKPNEIGAAAGLNDARQQGVAYLKRTGAGLAVDQIHF